MKKQASVRRNLLLTTMALILAMASQAEAARIKDLASIKGVRENQLVGYGLVVGLDGTGDGRYAGFTTQGLINMLENMGVQVDKDRIRVQNVAGVMVTAKLPPFVKRGQAIDVTISSLGDATSLKGGTLVATPLKGLDGKVYAIAQGPLSIGGNPRTDFRFRFRFRENHLTVGRIPDGATVEQEVPVCFNDKKEITLRLNSPDFTTVARMEKVINRFLGGNYAQAQDGGTVRIAIPKAYRQNEIALLADLEPLKVTPDSPAKIVLDERTGTVVMGENIRVARLALSHGNLSLQIAPVQGGKTEGGQPGDRIVTLREGTTVGEVVRALNSVGASPQDLIAIFQSMKAAGALQAELKII
jgi:flagellar P-ring protein precursor FlgI